MSALSRACNVADIRALANRALPLPIRDYLEGGAEDERTLARNTGAFGDWALLQGAMVDVSSVDTSAELVGYRSAMPLMLSPTGMSQLFHATGERAVARAAKQAGIPYGLSTMATTSIEDIARIDGMRYFQLYLFRDRGLTRALLERAAEHGFGALCLTVDTAVAGNRERDQRSGMIIPPRFTLGSLLSFAAHPQWCLGALRHRSFELANVVAHVGEIASGGTSIIDYVNAQFERSATWRDLEWLRGEWQGKLIVKGVIAPDDCGIAIDCGTDALMVSNHGGRQLDCAGAPIDYLPAIRDLIQNDAQLIADGGIRRGTDILKAIALGADGCSIGRPYLYGLAAGGEAGVARVLAIYRAELERDMALMGRTRIADVTGADVNHLSEFRKKPEARRAMPQSAGPAVRALNQGRNV